MQKGFLSSTILIGILVGVGLTIGGFLLYQKYTNPNSTSLPSSSSITQTKPQDQLFSGHIQKLTENLGLILDTNDSTSKKVDQGAIFYSAGTYQKGKYAGYVRYVFASVQGPGAIPSTIFASKDGKTFILDGEPKDISTIKDDDNIFWGINRAKIVAIDHLDSDHPGIIPLDNNTSLSKGNLLTTVIPISGKDQYGNPKQEIDLVTDFSPYLPLKSANSDLSFYSSNSRQDITFAAMNPQYSPQPVDSFIGGTTKVFVVDSTGLPFSYVIANSQKAKQYPGLLAAYDKALSNSQNNPNAQLPEYPGVPDLGLKKSDIQTNEPIFNSYNLAIPANCAFGGDTLVAKNISDSDLRKIGTSTEGDVYVLNDKNHLLNKTEFDTKITSVINISKQDGENSNPHKDPLDTFKQVNNGLVPISYDEYTNKNPLLFIKDYWGRWVVLGEFEYHLIGGCGKPVIYLYPQTPTKVSLKFLTPINFDLSIPTYKNSWEVLANPDGIIQDLQPQATNCLAIDTQKFGSEYAKDACLKNSYPYLYWAGVSTQKPYPLISKGWVVRKDNLTTFINDKLAEIGFNTKEKSDFTSYWIPRMLTSNAPYFRISFLQNSEMDQIAPMKITPTPTHYFRYFLDYLPLNEEPKEKIEPQNLNKITRGGFTIIEWGGHLF